MRVPGRKPLVGELHPRSAGDLEVFREGSVEHEVAGVRIEPRFILVELQRGLAQQHAAGVDVQVREQRVGARVHPLVTHATHESRESLGASSHRVEDVAPRRELALA